MPVFDATVTLGTVIHLVITLGGIWIAISRAIAAFDRRLSVFEVVLKQHAKTLTDHDAHMDRMDAILMALIGDVQRVIGQLGRPER